jgi:hypothetical protein
MLRSNVPVAIHKGWLLALRWVIWQNIVLFLPIVDDTVGIIAGAVLHIRDEGCWFGFLEATIASLATVGKTGTNPGGQQREVMSIIDRAQQIVTYNPDPSKGWNTLCNAVQVVEKRTGSVLFSHVNHFSQLHLGGTEEITKDIRRQRRLLAKGSHLDHLALGSEQAADVAGLRFR